MFERTKKVRTLLKNKPGVKNINTGNDIKHMNWRNEKYKKKLITKRSINEEKSFGDFNKINKINSSNTIKKLNQEYQEKKYGKLLKKNVLTTVMHINIHTYI